MCSAAGGDLQWVAAAASSQAAAASTRAARSGQRIHDAPAASRFAKGSLSGKLEDGLCVVCMARRPATVLVPCSHYSHAVLYQYCCDAIRAAKDEVRQWLKVERKEERKNSALRHKLRKAGYAGETVPTPNCFYGRRGPASRKESSLRILLLSSSCDIISLRMPHCCPCCPRSCTHAVPYVPRRSALIQIAGSVATAVALHKAYQG